MKWKIYFERIGSEGNLYILHKTPNARTHYYRSNDLTHTTIHTYLHIIHRYFIIFIAVYAYVRTQTQLNPQRMRKFIFTDMEN